MKSIASKPIIALLLIIAGLHPAAADTQQAPTEGFTIIETAANASALSETPAQHDTRMAWWREAKFGLFIHWGVYAVPAGKYGKNTSHGEWIMNAAKIPVAEYKVYANQFNPTKYNPDFWVKTAKDAGMKYIVITSKHHDGFTLFPSEASKWNIADSTPYKKDLLGPLVTAAKAQGVKIGFYYSQSQDWVNGGTAIGGKWDMAQERDLDDYIKKIAVPQVTEIVTRYPIDILWWDTPVDMSPQRVAPLEAVVKKNRPAIVMNNRLGSGFYGDFNTPEQFVPMTGYPGDWETCMTINYHWSFNAADHSWKSTTELIQKLADICSKGGNFLLDVGPTAEGEFPAAAVERLEAVGQWMKVNGDSIYGTQRGPFAYLPWGVATRKGDRLYLHVFTWPKDGKLSVPLNNQVKSAQLLATGENLSAQNENGKVLVTIPVTAVDLSDSVIVLQILGEPISEALPTLGAKATASAFIPGRGPENAIDGTSQQWRAPKDMKSAWLELELKQSTTIGAFGLDEPDVWPQMKQQFTLEAMVGGEWKKQASGQGNGHGTKQTITPVTTKKIRVTMECEEGSPGLGELQLYRADGP